MMGDMKERVLRVLKENTPEYISGEMLSRRLGVSRTAVWKYVNELKKEGYAIESSTKKGYKLVPASDILNEYEIRWGLETEVIGKDIRYFDEIDSTNNYAKRIAYDGCKEGTVIVADCQTAGRGRLGRSWLSSAGKGIWMSVILKPRIAPEDVQIITLAASVAVCRAIAAVTGIHAEIKWPNDVQVGGRKLCGILTEMEAEIDRVAFVVVGIGLNVTLRREQMDPAFRETATSLAEEGAVGVRRAALVQAILARFEGAYDHLLGGRFSVVPDQWRALSVSLGQAVRVLGLDGQVTVEGVAEAVDEEGALLVRDGAGEVHRVLSGEVSLRSS